MIKNYFCLNKGNRQMLQNIIYSIVFQGEGNHDCQNANHTESVWRNQIAWPWHMPDFKSAQAYGKSRGDPRYPDRIEKIDQSGFAFGYSLML